MILRYRADRRTMAWAVAMPLVALAPYAWPHLATWLWPLSCYLGLSAGVIAHNHNHCQTFKSRRLNSIFGQFLSIFYGYPTFAWVPTHNLNHHKFVNRAGDATITWRYTNDHHFPMAFAFPFISSVFQATPTNEYIRKAKATKPALYREIIRQYISFVATHVALIALAVGLHGWAGGMRLWLLMFALPAIFALWTIMFFNYIQHVHTDPWSDHNHSRSFTGAAMNFFLFNNGLHTAHHETPGANWSLLPALHAKLEAKIHPALVQKNFWGWCARSYLLAPFFPSMGTRQIGRAPFEDASIVNGLVTASVEASESGVNAPRIFSSTASVEAVSS
jgi:beta-carotene hydroxylase